MSVRTVVLVASMALVATMGAWLPAHGDPVVVRAPVLGPVEHVDRAPDGQGPLAVVVDTGGTTTAVWSDSYATSGHRHLFWIRAAHRGPGGVWSAPRTIGCTRSDECGRTYPSLAVDGAGRVTVAWAQDTRVLTRSWTRDMGWGPETVVAEETHPVRPGSVDLAVAPNGAGVLAWDYGDEALPVRVARKPAHRPWTTPVDLGRGWGPVAAVARSGVAVVALDDGGADLSARRFVPGDGWSSRHWFGGWPSVLGDVAMGPRGRALIVWGDGRGQDNDWYYMRGLEISPTGVWGRPFRFRARLARMDDLRTWPSSAPVASIDSGGTETVAWIHAATDTYTGVAARRAAGGSWAYTRFPGPVGNALQLVANQDGDLALGFPHQIRLRPRGGTWSAAARVGGRIGILPKGAAIRMWWTDLRLNAQTVR